MSEAKPTLGEARVRVSFNPSSNVLVDELKLKTAELIDLCERKRIIAMGSGFQEEARLWALAQTHFEDAAMWAVKAATS